MTTISAPLRASARPEGVASWPVTLSSISRRFARGFGELAYLALGVDVANVGSDTCVKSELNIVYAIE